MHVSIASSSLSQTSALAVAVVVSYSNYQSHSIIPDTKVQVKHLVYVVVACTSYSLLQKLDPDCNIGLINP